MLITKENNKEDANLEILGLSTRTYNALIRGLGNKRIQTVGDLLQMSYDDLKHARGLGSKGISEILVALHAIGLKFDFEDDEILPLTNDEYRLVYYNYRSKIQKRQAQIDKLQQEIYEYQLAIQSIEDKLSSNIKEKGFKYTI